MNDKAKNHKQKTANTSAVVDRMQELIDDNQFSDAIELWQSMAYFLYSADKEVLESEDQKEILENQKTILENNPGMNSWLRTRLLERTSKDLRETIQKAEEAKTKKIQEAIKVDNVTPDIIKEWKTISEDSQRQIIKEWETISEDSQRQIKDNPKLESLKKYAHPNVQASYEKADEKAWTEFIHLFEKNTQVTLEQITKRTGSFDSIKSQADHETDLSNHLKKMTTSQKVKALKLIEDKKKKIDENPNNEHQDHQSNETTPLTNEPQAEHSKLNEMFTKIFIEADNETQMKYLQSCSLSFEEKSELLNALSKDIEEKKEPPQSIIVRGILTALPIIAAGITLIAAPPAAPLVYVGTIIAAVAASKLLEAIYHGVAALMTTGARQEAHIKRRIETSLTLVMITGSTVGGIMVFPLLSAAAITALSILSVCTASAVTSRFLQELGEGLVKEPSPSIGKKGLSNTLLFLSMLTSLPRLPIITALWARSKLFKNNSSIKDSEKKIYTKATKTLGTALYAPIRPIIETIQTAMDYKSYKNQRLRKQNYQEMQGVIAHQEKTNMSTNSFVMNEILAGMGGTRTMTQTSHTQERLNQYASQNRANQTEIREERKELHVKGTKEKNSPPQRPQL